MLFSNVISPYRDVPHQQKVVVMLNYVKTVLTRVSFDARLFEKELRKAIRLLIAEEVQELRKWCYATFGDHQAILNRCFVAP